MTDLPPKAINPYAPAGTPWASAAHPGKFYCAHAVEWAYDGGRGGYLPKVVEADEMHPDIPVRNSGALPTLCQPATGFDPAKYPHAGPGAVDRAYAEVLRERRKRGT